MAAIFSQVPSHYSSVFSPLVYKVTNTAGEYVDTEIYTTSRKEPVGVKRFIGSGPVEVNISTYMRRCLSPSPFPTDMVELAEDPGRYVTAGVKCEGVMSPVRTYTGASRTLCEFELLSALPLSRTLAWDESDEVSLLVPDSSLTYRISLRGDKNYVFQSPEYVASRGIVTLVVGMPAVERLLRGAGMDPQDFTKMEVEIKNVGESVAYVEYDLCGRLPEEIRLCWYNSFGAIDYHTFRYAVSERMAVWKDTFLNHDGYKASVLRSERSTDLSSGLLPRIWIEGLAEVLSAPKVWRVGENGTISVDIISSGSVIHTDRLNSIDFSVRNSVLPICQNF